MAHTRKLNEIRYITGFLLISSQEKRLGKIFTVGLKETTSSPPPLEWKSAESFHCDTKKQIHHLSFSTATFSYLSTLILHGVLIDYENTNYSRLIHYLLEKIISICWCQHPDRVIPNWTPAVRVLLPSPCPSHSVTDHNLIRLKPHSLGTEPDPFSCFTGLFLKL